MVGCLKFLPSTESISDSTLFLEDDNMAVSMRKGEKLNVQKDMGLNNAAFGLDWDVRTTQGADYDLDFFMVLLNAQGKAAYGDTNESLVFYNHPANSNKSVYVLEDNRTGKNKAGEKYDEQGFIKFSQIPAEVTQIVACVSIYDFAERKQNFGQVNNARCDIINQDTGVIVATYDLTEDMSSYTGITVGRFRREANNSWSFKAVGEPVSNGMEGIIVPLGMSF